ncbi:MAG TPA: DUF6111 family protein [Pseudolabrys sp.]|jgi:hypothetical protein|nr:DUF6111 family protein [Pseudolabrys sp.]
MVRTGFTELLLFLTPFAVYAAFLFATRAGVLDPKSWPLRHVLLLVIVALLMVIGSFLFLAQFSGAPVGTTYVPAHVENGRLVPGAYK